MTAHVLDRGRPNPRLQCAVCGQWKRLHCKPYMSAAGYEADQTFFGGCQYTNGDHAAATKANADVCDKCCHVACKAKVQP